MIQLTVMTKEKLVNRATNIISAYMEIKVSSPLRRRRVTILDVSLLLFEMKKIVTYYDNIL